MDELELARLCGDTMWKDDKASQALGMEMEITGVGAATASMTIRDDMVNGLVALFRGRSATRGEPILPAESDTGNIEKVKKP